MKELSLHILDIAQNSIKAEASQIDIIIKEYKKSNSLSICIKDNGCGIEDEMIEAVQNPFVTSRTTRKVGLGISLFKMAAEQANGSLSISSKVGVGTVLTAAFQLDHIDRVPLGDFAGTISMMVLTNPDIDFSIDYITDLSQFELSTQEVKSVIGEVPITDLNVIQWIEDAIISGINEIGGGA